MSYDTPQGRYTEDGVQLFDDDADAGGELFWKPVYEAAPSALPEPCVGCGSHELCCDCPPEDEDTSEQQTADERDEAASAAFRSRLLLGLPEDAPLPDDAPDTTPRPAPVRYGTAALAEYEVRTARRRAGDWS